MYKIQQAMNLNPAVIRHPTGLLTISAVQEDDRYIMVNKLQACFVTLNYSNV